MPVSKVLHLKSAISALPNETIVGWNVQVDDSKHIKANYRIMPEESGAHVLIIDDSKVMIASDA